MPVCEKFCDQDPRQSRCSVIRGMYGQVDPKKPFSRAANLYTSWTREFCKCNPNECDHYRNRTREMYEVHHQGQE